MPIRLTPRQRELLCHQLNDEQWCTPMMLGGADGSHHSATLAQLVRKGLAERSNRGGHTRNVWQYRRTPAGKKAVNVCQFCGCGVGFGHTMCGPCSDVP